MYGARTGVDAVAQDLDTRLCGIGAMMRSSMLTCQPRLKSGMLEE